MKKLWNDKGNDLGQQFVNGNERIALHSLTPHYTPLSITLLSSLSSTTKKQKYGEITKRARKCSQSQNKGMQIKLWGHRRKPTSD